MPAESHLKSRRHTDQIELADIIREHGPVFLSTQTVPARHLKVMRQIVNCRTEVLGGHRHWCARCGYQRFVYHSCRNRHCPKCQTSAKEAWRKARQLELLPVPYFHNVFTLPHELNALILRCELNQRQLLKLLFDSAASTLLEFGRRELGGKVGFTMVLHTWDQLLRPHFHVHCLIASGAVDKDGKRWIAGGSRFLFPVRGLSKMFQGKFLDGLRQLLDKGLLKPAYGFETIIKQRTILRQLYKKSWVVYSKPPFAGPARLLDYLSRYTHRVAISNSRIKGLENGQVNFTYRDRCDAGLKKSCTLPAEQFIGRFLTHVLPTGFSRIRHYGYMANRDRKRNVEAIQKLLGVRHQSLPKTEPDPIEGWLQELVGLCSKHCPSCGEHLTVSEISGALPSTKTSNHPNLMAQPRKRGPP